LLSSITNWAAKVKKNPVLQVIENKETRKRKSSPENRLLYIHKKLFF